MNLKDLEREVKISPRHIYFRPRYGNGWKCEQATPAIDYEVIEKMGDFKISVAGVFMWEGAYRGFYGVVSEASHPLFGCNYVCWLMSKSSPIINGDITQRWDIYFSKQKLNPDNNDFNDPDSAGVGYGTPVLESNHGEA